MEVSFISGSARGTHLLFPFVSGSLEADCAALSLASTRTEMQRKDEYENDLDVLLCTANLYV